MTASPTSPEQAPGHYGAGYGEQVPAGATPQPAPQTDADSDATAPAGAAGTDAESARTAGAAPTPADSASDPASTADGDDGAPVVFTPADVHARPPDRPPTESAPESEKAGLIFERS